MFLKQLKHKPHTFYIKDWCNHRKIKTNTVRQLTDLLLEKHHFDDDGDIN